MNYERYEFCKMFVNVLDPSVVMRRLELIFEGEFKRRTMEVGEVIVDVLKNPDSGAALDFVGWPVLVELERKSGVADSVFSSLVDQVLVTFWKESMPTVAACDFESELTWSGGIGRLQ